MQEEQHQVYRPQAGPPPIVRKHPTSSALKIIALVLLVLVLLCGGAVTWIAYNAKSWMAERAKAPLLQVIDQSQLPEEQKARMRSSVTRLSDAFKAGRVKYTQLATLMARLAQGRFFDLISVERVRHQYRQAMPGDEETAAAAMLVFDRFERGIAEDTLSEQAITEVMSLVTSHNDKGVRVLKDDLTQTELRAFIDAARTQADAAAVPAEPYDVDFASILEQAVDGVLGPPATAPAATEPAESAEPTTRSTTASSPVP